MNYNEKKRSHLLPLLLSLFLIMGLFTAPLSFGADDQDNQTEAAIAESVEQSPDEEVVNEEDAVEGDGVIEEDAVEGDGVIEDVIEESTQAQPASTAPVAQPQEAPAGYTTDEHGLIAYQIKNDLFVDVQGFVEGAWISSTYSDRGFFPVVRIGGTEGQVYSARSYSKEAITQATGLVITPKPAISPDGKAIYLRYEIKNTGDTPVSFDFAIAADVEVDNNDSAALTMMPNGRAFLMVNEYSEATLAIFFANTSGVDAADGVWLGEYGVWDYFTNQQNDITGIDSAMSVFWLDNMLAVQQALTLGIGSAVGDMDVADALGTDEPEEPTATPVVAKAKAPGKVTPKDPSPKTGDSGVESVVLMAFLALGTAVVLGRPKRQNR